MKKKPQSRNNATQQMYRSTSWQTVRFGDVVRDVNESERNPLDVGLERYVGLEHIEPQNLRLNRWGMLADSEISFTKRFRKGQVLFGKRRAYQRKVAIAEFDGICSSDILTFEPKDDALVPELLPFIVQSDGFFEHALGTSSGSLSPRTRWSQLQDYEFPLPPKDEQHRIANMLMAADEVVYSHSEVFTATDNLADCLRSRLGIESSFAFDLHRIDDFVPPQGWKKTTGSEIVSAPITRGYTPTGSINTEKASIPFIKVYNLCFDGNLDFSKDPTFIEKSVHEGELLRSQSLPGDVLINLTGPPMGKVSLVPNTYPAWNINQAIARYRISDLLIRDYFLIYLQSHWAQNWFEMRAKKTSGQKNITLQLAQQLPVPIPPRGEMARFVQIYHAVVGSRDRVRQHSIASSKLKSAILNGYFA
jgi:type I restriction enzyme S subunit